MALEPVLAGSTAVAIQGWRPIAGRQLPDPLALVRAKSVLFKIAQRKVASGLKGPPWLLSKPLASL